MRFNTNKGVLTVEQLWDVRENDLIEYEETLMGAVESFGKPSKRRRSDKKTEQQMNIELMLSVVSHIIDTKVNEREDREKEASVKLNNERILELIKQKQDEELNKKSIEELKNMLK